MSENIGYAAYDLTRNEEIRIHSPKEYVEGEIVELKAGNYIHECKILKRLPEESDK
ncbi:hypothetical protein NSB24_28350 [Blautia coccoides]|uniref:Uncharacterized protein n=1 Tax=Blautia producta TaxID=33035 RepID=A0ABZ0U561_9FIRM|nr:hypothetical protein [Blautia coccoides]MCR1990090.1 hypothetical protein [Blautia coccoides]TCO46591.1 hypothetical protein EV205_16117 [Blautia coccoides]WPX72358.1 hypothetical protein BLCOC_06940 [Blautia coccoides]SUY05792.1 Uncharacterised protein [Blautia coccoides]